MCCIKNLKFVAEFKGIEIWKFFYFLGAGTFFGLLMFVALMLGALGLLSPKDLFAGRDAADWNVLIAFWTDFATLAGIFLWHLKSAIRAYQ